MPTITIAMKREFEDLQGLVNGTNKVFTVSKNIDSTKTILAYVNGQQNYLNEDFTLTGVNEVTFINAPQISRDGTYSSKLKLEYYESLT